MRIDATDFADFMVADPKKDNTATLGLVHRGHQRVPDHCGLCIFLRSEHAGRHDFDCLHGAPQQCGGFVRLRRRGLSRAQSQSQIRRFGISLAEYAFPVARHQRLTHKRGCLALNKHFTNARKEYM